MSLTQLQYSREELTNAYNAGSWMCHAAQQAVWDALVELTKGADTSPFAHVPHFDKVPEGTTITLTLTLDGIEAEAKAPCAMSDDLPLGWDEETVDNLVRETFQLRCQRRNPFTDEEWARQKKVSVTSVKMLRREVIEDIEAGEHE